jgi:capsular polysaccharide biosynthesis protein
MSDQPLDLRRSMQLLRRHKVVVAAFAVLGLAGGIGLAALSTPTFTSNALVVLPSSARDVSTQKFIATSDPVLARAARTIDPSESPQTLRTTTQVKNPTPDILSVNAQGKTAAQAERTADAVANSYVAYVNSPSRPGPPIQARILQPAQNAAGPTTLKRFLIKGVLGALIGLVIGAIVVLATRRKDRFLQERDQIADAIGIPVLTSIRVDHPTDAPGWRKLFEDYQPGVVDEWRLRKTLRQLWPIGADRGDSERGGGSSLAVLSLSSDPKALGLGPQLAVFAASLGIPTTLVVGPQQDANATAVLHTACATPLGPSERSRYLQVTVSDHDNADRMAGAGLTVIVAVVDGKNPRVADTMRAAATVLAVSAGAVTAEQLARVATSAATDGRDIAGTLVANPDPADHTTGRVPELSRPAQRRMPTRVTRAYAETRR